MKLDEKECTYIQCQVCGEVYQVNYNVPIDRSIINVNCPHCGSHKGLNCGNSMDDLYLYVNSYLDKRYY